MHANHNNLPDTVSDSAVWHADRDCIYYQTSGERFTLDGQVLQELSVFEDANVSVKGVPYRGERVHC